jgi:NAD(P)-dependent dehydrogenase (short-subunit alcohol dehydrogenase family)
MIEHPFVSTEKVALVTGASRGVGKGVVLGLAEAGATVYLTGRSTREGGRTVALPGTIEDTADEASALGGETIPLRCDHRNDDEVRAVIDRIAGEHGRLDVLVNNVWGGYEYLHRGEYHHANAPFWTRPLSLWDDMFVAGVRANYVTSALAVPLLTATGGGLIVHISFFAGQRYQGDVAYGVAKAATDRLAADMAEELRAHGVAVVSLYPGLVRTESVLAAAKAGFFDLTNSESPQFVGRAVTALAADPNVLGQSGRVLVAAELAEEYGFTDVDGARPKSLRERFEPA